jgi:hypothetical protein
MTRYGLVCLLIGSFSWVQAASLRSAVTAEQPATPGTSTAETATAAQGDGSGTSNVALNKPLITIAGLCDNPSAEKDTVSKCKTIVTEAQFEKVIDAVQPTMKAHARREFALNYADALVMAKKAEQMGLDGGAKYEEQMRLARIQILSQELKKAIQEKVSQVSDKDIKDYYDNNTVRFEKVEIDRIYVPKTQQSLSASDKNLSGADRQRLSHESEQVMKQEADNLRARAVAGEEFTTLQADAYRVAGIKSAAPNTSMVIRRSSLPPNQGVVMGLKAGEVSSVLEDPNGYDIYRVKTKDTLPLDQVREEVRATLFAQRMQDEMRAIQDSATTTLDESYFARSRPRQGMMGVGESTKPSSNPQPRKPD